jgi:tRNA pseudouridine65 synthase
VHSPLPVLFEDDDFIAINKPIRLLVHRTPISEDRVFALQLLRNQIGQRIYPVHRLDRGTSGVLIFGKTQEAAAQFSTLLRDRQVTKSYLAIIRGFVEEEGIIDYPLSNHPHQEPQDAQTHFRRIAQAEMPFHVNRYPTSRYSYVQIQPHSGRRHQIRRHFSHIRHPIIGDKKHGDVKHNNYFRKQFELDRLFLHSHSLEFIHPFQQKLLHIEAPLDNQFEKTLDLFGFR